LLFKYPGDVLLWFVVFLFANAVHESAHAFVSDKFGDYAGKHRVTLNPLAHIDPLGTIIFPLVGFLSGVAMFGWAKPFQATPSLWKNPRKANLWVSAAGPISNFILTIIGFVVIKILLLAGIMRQAYRDEGGPFTFIFPVDSASQVLIPIATLLSIFLLLNLTLGILNFLPIPPLDGSHVLESLLPPAMADAYAQIRPYGFVLLLILIMTPVLGWIIFPVRDFVIMLLLGR
jgi:Zn-dependent protease